MNPIGDQYWSEEAEAAFPLTPFYEEMAMLYSYITPHSSLEEKIAGARLVARNLLYSPAQVYVNVGDKKKPLKETLPYIPGSPMHNAYHGPLNKARVMVIGKHPGVEEIFHQQNMVGPGGNLFREICATLEIDYLDWYYTNICRWNPPKGLKMKGEHVKDCMPLLAQEIALLQPSYILVLGADAVKAVHGKGYNLDKARALTFLVNNVGHLRTGNFQNVETQKVSPLDFQMCTKLYATTHPSALLREEGLREGLVADLVKFRNMLKYDSPDVLEHSSRDCEYRYLESYEEFEACYHEIINGGYLLLSIDCEWGGGNFMRGKLRTIQISWREKQGVALVLTHAGGTPAMSPAERIKTMALLRKLVLHPGMAVTGHHLRADAKWLEHEGVPVMERMVFDTMLADHALNENAEHGLESLSTRFTDMGRYDYPLIGVLNSLGITGKVVKREGYLNVPTRDLLKYGVQDTDCTLRCTRILTERLLLPENAGPANCYFNISLPCMRPIHEIEMTGMMVDRERMEIMVDLFEEKKNELIDALRSEIQRPLFNPRSVDQVRALLFDDKDKGGFGLTPYKTTGKPARMWEDVMRLPENKRLGVNPSTDAESLEALAESGLKAVKLLRDFKLIDQVTKSFLRMPETDEFGRSEYRSGLVGAIDPDGRIRTSISQTSETGRQKSSEPNMTNLPSKQNNLLKDILGDDAPYIIRSCFVAPQGEVIVDADFQSAELYTLGYLASCPNLLKGVPGDLHARGAVLYLGAEKWDGFDEFVPPPGWWKSKYKHLRIGAKTLNFGIAYQRGAAALARQIVKETKGIIKCDKNQAQTMIDGFYNAYPEVRAYVDGCKLCVQTPGYIDNPAGFRRHATPFYGDQSLLAAQEREFVNCPVQGSVAVAENIALCNLYNWRKENPGQADYKIALAIHDANMLYVKVKDVGVVVERVFPECMSKNCVVPGWNFLPGIPPSQPFTLPIDVGLSLRWGEEPKLKELLAVGVEEKWAEHFAKRDDKGDIVL